MHNDARAQLREDLSHDVYDIRTWNCYMGRINEQDVACSKASEHLKVNVLQLLLHQVERNAFEALTKFGRRVRLY